ncbi:MAG: methyltransferase domain-containing protein [Bacteroidota bacterium]
MAPPISTVSWTSYARSYDLLMTYNPFYQALHQEVMAEVQAWQLAPGDRLADFGAGTGNYSLALAHLFPHAQVLHLDNDPGMNARAAEKQQKQQLSNLSIQSLSMHEASFPPESLAGLISIHALYTFPQPFEALEVMYQSLQSGREAILVNAGRIVQVLPWKIAIGWHLLKTHGWADTRIILAEGKEVSRQNALIRQKQRSGEYWTHSHEEFCAAVRAVGFKIKTARTTFRGISDLLVVEK